MPSPTSEPLSASHPPRPVHIMFIALVLVFFLSCLLAFLTPFALIAVYDLIRPLSFRFLNEFPLNQLEKLLLIPMLLSGASVGATLTHVSRWWLAESANEPWYDGLTAVFKRWGLASLVLSILLFQLRASYPEQPLISSGLLALIGAYTGYLIGHRQQQPMLGSALSQKMWITAMIVTWGIAWACVPSLIQANIDRL